MSAADYSWTSRDARRLLARHRYLEGGATPEEARYLRAMAMVLLLSEMPLLQAHAIALREVIAELEEARS